MITKKFRLTIDIQAIIPDKIPTDFVKRVVTEVDEDNKIPLYQPNTDKHQAVIDFIKNNETFHEKCITADLCFKINLDGFDKELKKLLIPGFFDDVALDAAEKMDIETKNFITRLYEEDSDKDDDDKIDADGNPLPLRVSKKQSLEAIKQEIDRRIIQESLLDYKLTAASLKVVKNGSQKVK